MKGSLYRQDKQRYVEKMPKFQRYFRKASEADWAVIRMLYRVLFKLFKEINHVEINLGTEIGGGLYIGHTPFASQLIQMQKLAATLICTEAYSSVRRIEGNGRAHLLSEMRCGLELMLQ